MKKNRSKEDVPEDAMTRIIPTVPGLLEHTLNESMPNQTTTREKHQRKGEKIDNSKNVHQLAGEQRIKHDKKEFKRYHPLNQEAGKHAGKQTFLAPDAAT